MFFKTMGSYASGAKLDFWLPEVQPPFGISGARWCYQAQDEKLLLT
jgi:hypothetical protein